ncbi:hypothetical protein IAT40_002269 [Kwoniella sp. CBS 6097]
MTAQEVSGFAKAAPSHEAAGVDKHSPGETSGTSTGVGSAERTQSERQYGRRSEIRSTVDPALSRESEWDPRSNSRLNNDDQHRLSSSVAPVSETKTSKSASRRLQKLQRRRQQNASNDPSGDGGKKSLFPTTRDEHRRRRAGESIVLPRSPGGRTLSRSG